MRTLRTAAALLAVALLAACATTTATAPRGDHGNVEATAPGPATAPHCGVERWAVKTGTDPGAASVDLAHVVPTTVTTLAGLPVPPGIDQNPDQRAAPAETTVYQVHAILVEYKQEGDNDWHLVIRDDQGSTMIAEIPAPACVGPGSPFATLIAQARAAFAAQYAPGDYWQPAGVPVVLTGVGFFDRLHGQTGVAPNGIELHPVLGVVLGGGPQPTASPSPAPTGPQPSPSPSGCRRHLRGSCKPTGIP